MLHFKIHSPLEELSDPLFSAKQVRVFIKRDDLIHPFISGNKWRKLKYILQEAQIQDKSHLVTFGGAYSNHLLATACAGAVFGFTTTGFVRGEPISNSTLMLCRLFGMALRFVDRESYRNKSQIFTDTFKDDPTAFFIDEGGASEAAVKGCSELLEELPTTFDHIFCAAGTGTTAAGILKGIQHHHLRTQLHVVPVLKNGGFLADEIAQYGPLTGSQLHLEYHFGGYAKTSPQLLTFIADFASGTGVLLDQVYTGKMAFAVYDLIAKDGFAPGSRLLLVHTGGLLGLMSQAEKILGLPATKV